MVPDAMVVEDGVEEKVPPRRSRSQWMIAAVSLAFGFAMGTLVTTGVEQTEEEAQPTDTVPVVEEVSPESAGVSAAIEDFPDAMVGVGGGSGAGLEVWHWPSDGPLATRGMTDGANVRFDATGQFVALTEAIPDLPGSMLSMGRFNAIRAVQSGVTSFAWHDSRSGEMAYTTEQDGSWQLYQASRTLIPELVIEDRFRGGSVVGWGDWGYAIQTVDDGVALVNENGEFKDFEEGVAFASHELGWIFMTDGDLKLVSAGGGVERLMPLGDELDPPSAASFSPDRSHVAVAGRTGVAVLDIDDRELRELSPRFPAEWVAWSSDSRFVMVPAQSGIYVHDLESGTAHHLLAGRSVVAASAFPAGAS